MAQCAPKNPPQYQTLRKCIDGTWHTKRQQLWVCVSDDGLSTWEEWRDIEDWQDTGQSCS